MQNAVGLSITCSGTTNRRAVKFGLMSVVFVPLLNNGTMMVHDDERNDGNGNWEYIVRM